MDAKSAAVLTTALQIHARTTHPVYTPPAPGYDSNQWSAFTGQWDMYKFGMAIANHVLPITLFYCCD